MMAIDTSLLVCMGYLLAKKGYVIYSPRLQPKVNKLRIHEVPKNNWFIFHMGQVSELWLKAMVNNPHVFNLSNCSVVFKILYCRLTNF